LQIDNRRREPITYTSDPNDASFQGGNMRYAQKLWIEDCLKNVVYLLSSDLEDEEAHRCEGYTTTMKLAKG
jgi:hypothetical protein